MMAHEAATLVPPDPPNGVLAHLGLAGCIRLPMRIDAAAFAAELAALPADVWSGAGRDPVVQAAVESSFAVGHPRSAKPLPPEDRPPLARLPGLRRFVRETVPAIPNRVIVTRLAAGGMISLHTDTPRFFRSTVRLSIQIDAAGPQRLSSDGLWYAMAPGEVWALDNLRRHGVLNAGETPRIAVLADFRPTDELLRLVLAGETGLGIRDEKATRELEERSRERYRRERWKALRYEASKWLTRRRAQLGLRR